MKHPWCALVVFVIWLAISYIKAEHSGSNGALIPVEAEDEDGFVEEVDKQEIDEIPRTKLDNPDVEQFVPTKEWQEIKPGQSIPQGLHVQMNLQTGKREAKLMEGDDGSSYRQPAQGKKGSTRLKNMKRTIEEAVKDFNIGQSSKSEPLKYWTDGEKEGMAHTKKDSFSRAELKEALKKFKTTKTTPADSQGTGIEGNFRTSTELKQDMDSLGLSVKTDPEIIKGLLEHYQQEDVHLDMKLSILTDLEYYVHQIDNALDFTKMGGLTLAVLELNNTQLALQQEAAYVIGSAVQSNAAVQIEAIEAGALHQLLRMLAMQPDDKLQNKVLYAISALLRNFPYAQQKFVELGGIHTLTKVLVNGSSKIKLKAVTLINDLVTEKMEAQAQSKSTSSETLTSKLQQYSLIHLDENVAQQGWCPLVVDLIHIPEHDAREKVVTAMGTLLATCRDEFLTALPALRSLRSQYKVEADDEQQQDDEDSFFRDLLAQIVKVVRSLELYQRGIDL